MCLDFVDRRDPSFGGALLHGETEKWLRENRIHDVEADIAKIDNEIAQTEAEINAAIFKFYRLEEKDAKIVFDSLKTLTSHQVKVLEFFRKL